jgi:hypothetical protein
MMASTAFGAILTCGSIEYIDTDLVQQVLALARNHRRVVVDLVVGLVAPVSYVLTHPVFGWSRPRKDGRDFDAWNQHQLERRKNI